MASEPLGPVASRARRATPASTLTAETHNFPSGVAPYPGAATGTGGRIRDNQAVGRGGLVCAGRGLLRGQAPHPRLPAPLGGGRLPITRRPGHAAGDPDQGQQWRLRLRQLLRRAGDRGFTRTFGLRTPDGYRYWYKPIMYSVGAGQIRDEHMVKKGAGEGHAGGPGGRPGLPHRHGRRRGLLHEPGQEHPGTGLQRRPTRRS